MTIIIKLIAGVVDSVITDFDEKVNVLVADYDLDSYLGDIEELRYDMVKVQDEDFIILKPEFYEDSERVKQIIQEIERIESEKN